MLNAVRRVTRFMAATVVVAFCLLVEARVAHASYQGSLYYAAANWAECDLRWFGRLFSGLDIDYMARQIAKCRIVYANTWKKVSHDAPRFYDNGDGTVSDALTGLQWEQKTDDGSIHDKDNVYTWSTGFEPANGTVFTTFLAALNGPCFANQCDWRLPTRTELETIVLPQLPPCGENPCIDQSFFGPTAANLHWSGTANPTGPGFIWGVQFGYGFVGAAPTTLEFPVRAVRGGF